MEPELFEELKQCEDNSVNYIDFMESTELKSRIEELFHLEEATILSDFNQGLYYSTQPPYEKVK